MAGLWAELHPSKRLLGERELRRAGRVAAALFTVLLATVAIAIASAILAATATTLAAGPVGAPFLLAVNQVVHLTARRRAVLPQLDADRAELAVGPAAAARRAQPGAGPAARGAARLAADDAACPP